MAEEPSVTGRPHHGDGVGLLWGASRSKGDPCRPGRAARGEERGHPQPLPPYWPPLGVHLIDQKTCLTRPSLLVLARIADGLSCFVAEHQRLGAWHSDAAEQGPSTPSGHEQGAAPMSAPLKSSSSAFASTKSRSMKLSVKDA